jgi:hypothetical protein
MLNFCSYRNSCFSKKEKENLYKQTLNFILNFLNDKKPDLIINTHIPHNFFEVMLAEVCEIKKINHIYVRHFGLPNIYVIQNYLYRNDNKFLSKFKNNLLDKKIFQNIYTNLFLIKNDKLNVELKNNKWQDNKLLFSCENKFFFIFIRFLIFIKNSLKIYLKSCYLLIFHGKKSSINYFFLTGERFKNINYAYLKKKTSRIFQNYINFYSDIRKFNLVSKYTQLSLEPNYKEKFIYYPLWYQPSASTYPFGGRYVDNISAIKFLSRNSKNFKIYVKEHEDTFNLSRHAWTRGSFARDEKFYEILSKIPNVRLINLLESDGNLISRSQAVATLPSKMLFSSIAKEKPVILFGSSPLSNLKNVFQVSNNYKINLDYILNNFTMLDSNKINKSLLEMSKICFFTDQMNSFNNLNLSKDNKKMSKIIMQYCSK